MREEFKVTQNVITGARMLYAFGDEAWHLIGVIPRTKWAAVNGMQASIVDLCRNRKDWESVTSACQSMIDAAPSVLPGDITAQVFDPLKLLRPGSHLGDLLKKAADGEPNAGGKFLAAVTREEMVRAFGCHIIRFTKVTGEALGTGILLILPDGNCAIMTCSHVWAQIKVYEQVQMLCAAIQGSVALNERMIRVAVDDLCVLDMADHDFMIDAGIDPLQYKRDSCIIAGEIGGLIPIGARAFDLRGIVGIEPDCEKYALVGYPCAANGELGTRLLEYESSGRNNYVFTQHPADKSIGSLNGASGGLVVAVCSSIYRPVALMVEEQGAVAEASVGLHERPPNPSAFHALPLVKLREMIERAGFLRFKDREGRIVRDVRGPTHGQGK